MYTVKNDHELKFDMKSVNEYTDSVPGKHSYYFDLIFCREITIARQMSSSWNEFSLVSTIQLLNIWAAPVAEWLRPLIFSALNSSSSHPCGFESRSGHMWDKPSSACGWFFSGGLPFSPHLTIDSAQNDWNNLDQLNKNPKNCCNYPKIWTMSLFHRVMSPNDADRMANSVDPDQTVPLRAVWSAWVYTVCAGLSVRKHRIIPVLENLHKYWKM